MFRERLGGNADAGHARRIRTGVKPGEPRFQIDFPRKLPYHRSLFPGIFAAENQSLLHWPPPFSAHFLGFSLCR
jgi:hypothetical protein